MQKKEEEGVLCEGPAVEKHIEAEMSWPCTSLMKKEQRRSSSLKIPYLPLCVYLSCSQLSLTLLFQTFHYKKERKEVDYIFIHQSCCVLLPSIQHLHKN